MHKTGRSFDWVLTLGLFFAVGGSYVWTLLPDLGQGDTAEFQWVVPTLGIAHSTGYPLYMLLGWLWVQLVRWGSLAWRLNLFSAFCGTLAVVGLFATLRMLDFKRIPALVAALTLAFSLAFWGEATHAEVWGLATLLQVALLAALIAWRHEQVPLWLVGLVLGLNLVHHRSSFLMLPGIMVFVLLTQRPPWRKLLQMSAITLLPLSLYLYIPWRADPAQRWILFREYLLGSTAEDWLDPARFAREGWSRVSDVLNVYVLHQLTLVGLLIALLGCVVLFRRDRALAWLLFLSASFYTLFCLMYYVADLAVFLIPLYVLAVVWFAQGLAWCMVLLPQAARTPLIALALLIPCGLFFQNKPLIKTYHTLPSVAQARVVVQEPLPPQSVVIGSWMEIETLRYLQTIEGAWPDVQLVFHHEPNLQTELIPQTVQARNQVFALEPYPNLQFVQRPESHVWRLLLESPPPPHLEPRQIEWNDGIILTGATIPVTIAEPSMIIPLELEWFAQTQPSHDYVLFTQLIGPDGKVWGQHDRPPATLPTSQWQPEQTLHDVYGPRLAPDAPAGDYRLIIGWYQYPSLTRLKLADDSGDFVELATVKVIVKD